MSNLTVVAPKEVVDVLVALDSLVAKIIAKEPVSQLVVDELSEAIALAGEVSALPADVQSFSDQCVDAGALYGRRMVYRLMGKAVVPVVVS